MRDNKRPDVFDAAKRFVRDMAAAQAGDKTSTTEPDFAGYGSTLVQIHADGTETAIANIKPITMAWQSAEDHGLPEVPPTKWALVVHSRLAANRADAALLALAGLGSDDTDEAYWAARTAAHHGRRVLAAIEAGQARTR